MKASMSTLAVAVTAIVVWLAATTVNQAAQRKSTAAAGAAGTSRIAVVDIVKVFDMFEQTVTLNKKLDDHTKKILDEAERRAKQGQEEQKALEAFTPDSAEYFKQNEKVKKLMFENEVWRQIERDNIAEHHKRWVLRTYQMMTAEIEKVAKAHDVDIVLTREKLKTDVADSKALLAQILNIKVIYASADSSIDLSDEVLTNLNAEFAKRGGAAAVEFGK